MKIHDLEYNWKILYDFRTKAAHLGLISNNNYLEFKNVLKRTKQILNHLFNKLLQKELNSLYEKSPSTVDGQKFSVEYNLNFITKLKLDFGDEGYLVVLNITFLEASQLFHCLQSNNNTEIYAFSIKSLIDLIEKSEFSSKSRQVVKDKFLSSGINIG